MFLVMASLHIRPLALVTVSYQYQQHITETVSWHCNIPPVFYETDIVPWISYEWNRRNIPYLWAILFVCVCVCFDISLETMSNSVVLFLFEFDTKFKWKFLFQPILPNTLLPLVHNRSLSFPNIVLNTFKLSN